MKVNSNFWQDPLTRENVPSWEMKLNSQAAPSSKTEAKAQKSFRQLAIASLKAF